MRVRRWARVLLVTGIAALSACSLTTDLSGFASGSGPAGVDGASSGNSGSEAAALDDAVADLADGTPEPLPDSSIAPEVTTGGVLVAANAGAFAAGAAQQHHVHFAKNLGAYVVFHYLANDKSAIHTKLTSDFRSFVDGPSIALPKPTSGDGRDFDVAYASLLGTDIFHVAMGIHSGSRYCLWARGRAAKGGALSFSNPIELDRFDENHPEMDPDGVSVALLATGRGIVSSGFADLGGHWGNPNVFVAQNLDIGEATYDPNFAAPKEIEYATAAVNARSIIPYPESAGFIWERGDTEPRSKSLAFSIYDGDNWSTPDRVGITDGTYDNNDWSQAVTAGGLRADFVQFNLQLNAYQHKFWQDHSGHTGAAFPSTNHSVGDGVVLLDLADGVHAFTLGVGDKPVRDSRLDMDAKTWSAWTNRFVADSTRSHLAGSGDILLWQKGTDLVGAKLGP